MNKNREKTPGKFNMLFVEHSGSQREFYDISVVVMILSKTLIISKFSSSTVIRTGCENKIKIWINSKL